MIEIFSIYNQNLSHTCTVSGAANGDLASASLASANLASTNLASANLASANLVFINIKLDRLCNSCAQKIEHRF